MDQKTYNNLALLSFIISAVVLVGIIVFQPLSEIDELETEIEELKVENTKFKEWIRENSEGICSEEKTKSLEFPICNYSCIGNQTVDVYHIIRYRMNLKPQIDINLFRKNVTCQKADEIEKTFSQFEFALDCKTEELYTETTCSNVLKGTNISTQGFFE